MNGIAAEYTLARLLKQLKCKPVQFSSIALIKIAEKQSVGQRRIKQAAKFLINEYGTTHRRPNGQLYRVLDWSNVPPTEVLDRVFGIDALVNYRGWVIAFDATVNPDSLQSKQSKMSMLNDLYQSIGIDVAFPILLNADVTANDVKTLIRFNLPN